MDKYNLYYAGVGSRKTPLQVCNKFIELAEILGSNGWTLRSGAAQGADDAFEQGSDNVKGNKEIYLAWKGASKHSSSLYNISSSAFQMARAIHPAWDKCSIWAKKLHARNCYQVLGEDLKTPSKFLVCWTPSGNEVGGTRTAILLARNNNIPVYNFGHRDYTKEITERYL